MKRSAKSPTAKLMGKKPEPKGVRGLSARAVWILGLIFLAVTVGGSVTWIATEELRENPVVAHIDGVAIRRADVNQILANQWWQTPENAIRDAAVTEFILREARSLGISLSRDERNEIRDNVSEWQNSDPLGFRNTLDEAGIMSAAHLRRIFEAEALLLQTVDAIVADPVLFAEYEAYMPPEEYIVAAKHILISFTEQDPDTFATITREREEVTAQAEYVLSRVLAGDDFDYLVATYGEDPGMVRDPQGYTFVDGVMVDEFYLATRELQIGEISGLVPAHHGYHIIMRVEPDYDNVRRPQGAPEPTEEWRRQMAVVSRFEAIAQAAEVSLTRHFNNFFGD